MKRPASGLPMEMALAAAVRAMTLDEVPVGAVIIHAGAPIAITHNLVETRHDPSAHAEILAIRMAASHLGTPRLFDCDLFVTLEPCAMCAQAIAAARIRRLYYATADPKGGAVDSGLRLFDQPTCHHRPEVYGGLAEKRAGALLRQFFAHKRQAIPSEPGSATKHR